ncbi:MULTISPECIES: AzlC family ABC transporter permease [unclassified Schaalia]|uniref:AzlC family ABC transporter permease n=1 Tax=unclassified Schaalia TaxID=2691889 RepID=UPI001E469A0B|nr:MULTISPECIES: AzlC family ABC transporter permease [unclassified Schaalia]MCD4550331.1 AzlC family ABC transporter permease [Schaalia sp. lx-260]MCD4557763.1 AzlC family ABC transporter permease [Schaalia sp. lx-100]
MPHVLPHSETTDIPSHHSCFREISRGIHAALPATLAMIPLGLALGVVVTQSGLAWWWGPLLATCVYAGSLEFLLVGMLAALAPLSQIALTALLVNFRHIFYALSFPINKIRGIGWKIYGTFGLTDEVYAVTASARPHNWSHASLLSIVASIQWVWIASVTFGAFVGNFIPPYIKGLNFAVTALFTVLTLESYRYRRSIPISALALCSALIGIVTSPHNMLLISMTLFVTALIGRFFLLKRKENRA